MVRVRRVRGERGERKREERGGGFPSSNNVINHFLLPENDPQFAVTEYEKLFYKTFLFDPTSLAHRALMLIELEGFFSFFFSFLFLFFSSFFNICLIQVYHRKN
jgi:hypothetical protein